MDRSFGTAAGISRSGCGLCRIGRLAVVGKLRPLPALDELGKEAERKLRQFKSKTCQRKPRNRKEPLEI